MPNRTMLIPGGHTRAIADAGRRALAAGALAGALLLGGCLDGEERELSPYRPALHAGGYAVVEIGYGAEVRAVDGKKVMIGNEYWMFQESWDLEKNVEIYLGPYIRRLTDHQASNETFIRLDRYNYGGILLAPGEHRLEIASTGIRIDRSTGELWSNFMPEAVPLSMRFQVSPDAWHYEVSVIGTIVFVVRKGFYDASTVGRVNDEILASSQPVILGMNWIDANEFIKIVDENRRVRKYSTAQLLEMQFKLVAANRKKIREAGWAPHP